MHVEPKPECDHKHAGPCNTHDHRGRSLGWGGLFFGLALHTVIDGVAFSESMLAAETHLAWIGLAGLGTFLAIVLQQPLNAFATTAVIACQGPSDVAQ